MYKYNLFCFGASALGTFIALFIVKNTEQAIFLLVLAVFNYIAYYVGKVEANDN